MLSQPYCTPALDLCQPLVDKTPNAKKPQPWREHRLQAELLAAAYQLLHSPKSKRLLDCAEQLQFSYEGDTMHLQLAWFCRVRLCPICQWRRSLKLFAQTIEAVKILEQQQNTAFAFLTLTVKNCAANELSNTISHLLSSFRLLSRQKPFLAAFTGWQRSLEVTYNATTDTYHPHLHILLCCKQSYFKSRYYLSHAQLQAMWQAAAKLDYEPQVHIQRVKSGNPAAVAELTKYTTKPSDYLDGSDLDATMATVQVLDAALHRRRLVAFGGRFADVRKQLNLEDPEDGDLLHLSELEQEALASCTTFHWAAGYKNYFREKAQHD